MNEPLITIIVPVYNVERWIEPCLESIVHQSFQYFEVLLIDDASTDRSSEICDEWEARDLRIRVIHKKTNEGLSAARNTGVRFARGTYISFVDSDDLISPQYLEKMYALAETHRSDVVYCHFTTDMEEFICEPSSDMNPAIAHPSESLWEKIAETGSEAQSLEIIVAWNKLIRTNIAKAITFPEGKWHEDEFYINRLLLHSGSFMETAQKLYFYRQREDSITSDTRKHDPRHMDIIDAFEERVTACSNVMGKDPHNGEQYRIYRKILHGYRSTIIIQYHDFRTVRTEAKLRIRFIRSFFKYGNIVGREFLNYLHFLFLPKHYYRNWPE